jgi:uncharacterized membrane protein YGL010W
MMNIYFKRQLADYVEYHRDPWNCLMHVFGIISLFAAAVLPLSLCRISVFGAESSLAPIMALPVLVYWLLLDTSVGLAILGVAALLLATAATIAGYTSVLGAVLMSAPLMIIGVVFQVVGHRFFERRQPALVDNPAHLLIGPMFVMAKLFIAFGFRRDLAAIIAPPRSRQDAPRQVTDLQEQPIQHS